MRLFKIIFLLQIFSVCNLFSQTLNNNGGFITAQSGSYIHVNGSVSNNNSGILAVNGNGTPTSSELYVTQDVVNNSTINADGYIRLLGNWIDNSSYNSTLGTVFFEGGNQFLGGTSVTQFFNVTLDGTGIKTQQIDKISNGTLDLKHIQLNTDLYGFYVTNTALNSIIRTTGFVSSANGGFLARTTQNTGTYLFPTGSTANTSSNIPGSGTFRYRPVELNPFDANTNVYSVRLANLDATQETYNRNSTEPLICDLNPLFYHQIDRISGSSAADIGVCFIPLTDGLWNDLARWNINTNGIWQDIQNVTISNITGFTKVTSTTWNNFGDIPYILSNLNPPNPTITNPPITGCSPLTASLQTNGQNALTYTWSSNGSNIGSGTTISQTFSNAGCYDITLTSTIGTCSSSVTIPALVCVEANPIAAFMSNPMVLTNINENVNFTNNSVGATSYSWDFGDGDLSNLIDPSHNYSNITGNFLVTLTASSAFGCTDDATMVLVYQENTVFYIPNSFTPDQDGFNQTWGPVFTSGFDPFNFDLYIFDRWGELIWESHDASAKWDGTIGIKGKKATDGVYTYRINYKPKETDKKYHISGHITLIR